MKTAEQTKIREVAPISSGGQKNIDRTSVALVIVNVNKELQKLETRDKNKTEYSTEFMDKITRIYEDLIEMLNRFPQFPSDAIDHQDVNLFYPLMKLISISLSQGRDVGHLTDTFALLIWHHLNHAALFQNFMRLFGCDDSIVKPFCQLVLELSPNVQTVYFLYEYWYSRKIMEGSSEEVGEGWHALSMGFIRLVTDNIGECHKILAELENMKSVAIFTKADNKKLTDILVMLIEWLGSETKRELIALMFPSMGLIEILESFSQHEITNVNSRCISKVIETIRYTLMWHDPYFVSTEEAFLDITKNKSISFKLDSKHSILFLLEILDHGEHFNYLESYNLLCYLSMSLKNLNNLLLKGKQELYQQYNQLNSKISLTALLANLNYIISSSLLSIDADNEELPDIISNHFNQTRLPPLPKSDYFFDDFNNKDSFDNDLSLANNNGNLVRLVHCQLLSLHLLLQILRDELYAISIMNTYSADQVNLKLLFRLIDLLFSSLFPSLVFLQKYDDTNGFDTQATRDIIFNIYHKLISIDHKSTQNSLTWVCLINFASDICYFDLRFVPIFESLFTFLVDKTASNKVLEDELVKSGLSFFFSTFKTGDTEYENIKTASKVETSSGLNPICFEISYDDCAFMYAHLKRFPENQNPSTNDQQMNPSYVYSSMQKDPNENRKQYTNTNNNDLLFIFEPKIADSSTPLKTNYVTNFARQQSIHVDQYGKS